MIHILSSSTTYNCGLSHEAGTEELQRDYEEDGDADHLRSKSWSVAVHLLVGVLAPSVVLRAGEDTLASCTGG